MPTKLGIVSAKGGVGKTTAAINLATSLYDFDQEVTLVDANMLNPNISLHLDLPQATVALQHVLNSDIDVSHCVKAHHTGLKIIPSSISIDAHDVDIGRLGEVLGGLDGTIIIDSPPGIGENTKHVIDSSDRVVVVTTPDLVAVADSAKTVKLAEKMSRPVAGVIVNRARNDSYELTTDEIEIICDAPVIAKIPEDREVRRAQFQSMPVVRYNPYAKATIEFNFLAAKLLSKSYKPPNMLAVRRLFRF